MKGVVIQKQTENMAGIIKVYRMFERYACPRFTVPDESGEIILDYCVYIK